jgi:hypothetical protein
VPENIWRLLEEDEIPEPDPILYPDRSHYDVHCLCGRFAKYRGGRNYYNGTWDCYSFDVECKRCGVITVECV